MTFAGMSIFKLGNSDFLHQTLYASRLNKLSLDCISENFEQSDMNLNGSYTTGSMCFIRRHVKNYCKYIQQVYHKAFYFYITEGKN